MSLERLFSPFSSLQNYLKLAEHKTKSVFKLNTDHCMSQGWIGASIRPRTCHEY